MYRQREYTVRKNLIRLIPSSLRCWIFTLNFLFIFREMIREDVTSRETFGIAIQSIECELFNIVVESVDEI